MLDLVDRHGPRWVSVASPSRATGRVPTIEAWAALPEDDRGEWLDGVLVDEEVPSAIHELVVATLLATLHAWAQRHGALVLGSGLELKVAPRRGRTADIVIYLSGARRPETRGLVTAPPSLAVEVISDTRQDERRDRIDKLAEYLRQGSPGIGWSIPVHSKLGEARNRVDDALGRADGVYLATLGVELEHFHGAQLVTRIDRGARSSRPSRSERASPRAARGGSWPRPPPWRPSP